MELLGLIDLLGVCYEENLSGDCSVSMPPCCPWPNPDIQRQQLVWIWNSSSLKALSQSMSAPCPCSCPHHCRCPPVFQSATLPRGDWLQDRMQPPLLPLLCSSARGALYPVKIFLPGIRGKQTWGNKKPTSTLKGFER